MSTVKGIPETPYNLAALLAQYPRSLTWFGHDKLSFSIASSQRARSLSRDTLMTVKPLSLYFSYNPTTCGFSRRQGPHQEAQKSRRTTFPRKSESFIELPSGSNSSKSRASYI